MCRSDDPDIPLDDDCMPPDFMPDPEDELAPMLLPVDLF